MASKGLAQLYVQILGDTTDFEAKLARVQQISAGLAGSGGGFSGGGLGGGLGGGGGGGGFGGPAAPAGGSPFPEVGPVGNLSPVPGVQQNNSINAPLIGQVTVRDDKDLEQLKEAIRNELRQNLGLAIGRGARFPVGSRP